MTVDLHNGRYRHDVERWTVGELRAALSHLPDDTVLRVEVAHAPSTGHPDPWGNDQFVVTDATLDDDGDFATGDVIVRVDYSSDWYMLPETPSPQALYERVLLDDADELIAHQGGAFPSEDEAQNVLDTWRAEGRTERMAINVVPLYQTARQWEADR